MRYFFSGISGSGMRPLAFLALDMGVEVGGSDRVFASDPSAAGVFEQAGISIFPQDGSGIDSDTGLLVVSGAIEDMNPDIRAARARRIKIVKRAELLADFSGRFRAMAVAGTSGKTTVSGMAAHVLSALGHNPLFMIGAPARNADGGQPRFSIPSQAGDNERLFVFEADESDGSLVLYRPEIGLINNISKDHKAVEELTEIFVRFAANVWDCLIVNADDAEIARAGLCHKNIFSFGTGSGADMRLSGFEPRGMGSLFRIDEVRFRLNVPGFFNAANALATAALCTRAGLKLGDVAGALESFCGMHRRFERINPEHGSIAVFDDFAHNPHKISCALAAATGLASGGRLIAVFQPHGYGPLRFMKDEFAAAFAAGLREGDELILMDIYDAGGTADRSISSAALKDALSGLGRNCVLAGGRKEACAHIADNARTGDVVLLMGARDPSLPEFGRMLAGAVEKR